MQRFCDDKNEYSKRINDEASRCGNLHDSEDVVTMYIHRLDLNIRTIVHRYRETHCRATFLELVQHSKYEEESTRARGVDYARESARTFGVLKSTHRTVNLVQCSSESGMTTAADEQHETEALCFPDEMQ